MGIFDFVTGMSSQTPSLQELLLGHTSNKKIVIPKDQLLKMANQRADQDIKIINDSTKILQNTIKPDVFFSRLDLFKEKIDDLALLSPYIKIKGTSPYALKQAFDKDKETMINNFVDRCRKATEEKISTLKTQKAKDNQCKKFVEMFDKYKSNMSEISYKRVEMIAKAMSQ